MEERPRRMMHRSTVENILLVDDEKEFVDTISERLGTRGIGASVVYSGEEALAWIEAHPTEVVVLDIRMPGMDGLEVLGRIKQRRSRIEVIMLTGHGSAREARLAEELGVFAYFTKPQDIDRLAATIRRALDAAQSPKPRSGVRKKAAGPLPE
jgi:two-component system, OmpR family, response regulator CpxR